MTKLRQKMIEDMQLRGYTARTQESYIGAVQSLAKHYKRPPDQLSEDDCRKDSTKYVIMAYGVRPTVIF